VPRITAIRDGHEFLIKEGRNSVGRAADNDIVVSHPSVSLNHCFIKVRINEVTVEDLGSENGTFINDTRITSANLEPGQIFRIGNLEFRHEASRVKPIALLTKHIALRHVFFFGFLAFALLSLADIRSLSWAQGVVFPLAGYLSLGVFLYLVIQSPAKVCGIEIRDWFLGGVVPVLIAVYAIKRIPAPEVVIHAEHLFPWWSDLRLEGFLIYAYVANVWAAALLMHVYILLRHFPVMEKPAVLVKWFAAAVWLVLTLFATWCRFVNWL